MKYVWNEEKNQKLIKERGISFEMVLESISYGKFQVKENMSKNHP